VARLLELVPTTGAHLRSIAERFRPEERLECMASWGEEPLVALTRSWLFSKEAVTCLTPDRKPLCVLGINDEVNADGWAEFWLLGTTDILKHKIAFLRTCRDWKPLIAAKYPRLRSHIDARYDLSLRWAKWLGCEICAPAPFGKNGALFCEVRLTWAAQ
jgi:hypothetical protein